MPREKKDKLAGMARGDLSPQDTEFEAPRKRKKVQESPVGSPEPSQSSLYSPSLPSSLPDEVTDSSELSDISSLQGSSDLSEASDNVAFTPAADTSTSASGSPITTSSSSLSEFQTHTSETYSITTSTITLATIEKGDEIEVQSQLLQTAESSSSTPVASSDYVRVSERLRGVTISAEEFEKIKNTPLFDDRQLQERENVGSAWGRFESAKECKHFVMGLDQLSPAAQDKIRSEFEQRPNVVPNVTPGTPSSNAATPITHVWTPSHTTRLEPSCIFTIGEVKITVCIEKRKLKRASGFVQKKNLSAEFDKLYLKTASPLRQPVTGEDKENTDPHPVLNEGWAVFSADKYKKSHSLDKQGRSQIAVKKEKAAAFLERSGYEVEVGGDGKQEAEWLDGLSRDLLRRAAVTIVINDIQCKLVQKNLNLVALNDKDLKNKDDKICTKLILFAGTRGCNTHMMIAEGVVKTLLRREIDVKVRYQYINDREMYYYIETDKTETIRFVFDTKKYDSPTSLEPILVNTVISQIIEAAAQKHPALCASPSLGKV